MTKSSGLTFFILESIISPSRITLINVSSWRQSPSNIAREHFHLSLPLASISLSTLILPAFLFNSRANLFSSAFFFCSIQSNIEFTISDFRIDLINLSVTSYVNPKSFTSVISFSLVWELNEGFTTVAFKNKNMWFFSSDGLTSTLCFFWKNSLNCDYIFDRL
jgi:hypothetical protein